MLVSPITYSDPSCSIMWYSLYKLIICYTTHLNTLMSITDIQVNVSYYITLRREGYCIKVSRIPKDDSLKQLAYLLISGEACHGCEHDLSIKKV